MSHRAGEWLFRHRTWLPQPIVLILVLIPPSSVSTAWVWTGVALTLGGELLRLLAVREIGVISRTRSDRLGPLVGSGPFAFTRNPLYIGNMAIWIGFTLAARLPWLAPAVAAVLFIEYYLIVAWEESLLESRLGESYREYKRRVPRWMPLITPELTLGPADQPDAHRSNPGPTVRSGAARYGWRETLFSERGTLVAIAAGYLLLYLKETF